MFCKNCGNQLPDNSEFCNKCGTKTSGETSSQSTLNQPIYNQQIPSAPPKKKKGKGCLITLGIVVVLVIVIAVAAGSNGGSKQPVDNTTQTQTVDTKLTLEKFNTIQNGMTYEEVVNVIGSEGTILSETGEKGSAYYTVIYMYSGDQCKGDIGANANFTFQNNKLMNKTQINLK